MKLVKIGYPGGEMKLGEVAFIFDMNDQPVGIMVVNTGSLGPYIAASNGESMMRIVIKAEDVANLSISTIVVLLDDLLKRLDFELSEEWKSANLERIPNR